MTGKTIVLAAGGTGGHLYPAEALAQELLNRGHRVVIVTDKRGAAFKNLGERVRIECVKAATFRPGIMGKLGAFREIFEGILQARKLLREIKPDIAVGFGGYPSYPTMFAAQRLCIRSVLHEQNAVLGRANKWLAGKACKIAASLPDTKGLHAVDHKKLVVTGNPVRAGIVAVRERPYPPFEGDFEIFITGGSQAAKVFSEVVPEAVQRLSHEQKGRLHIVHQCRESEVASTERKYRMAGVRAEIKTFFTDMPERLTACHLFIGRSGASTVAEIAVAGRPAIFVPYPGHRDMQQLCNAELLAEKNGAWVMLQELFSPEVLARQLDHLMKAPDELKAAAAAAKSCGQPDAVQKLADVVEQELK